MFTRLPLWVALLATFLFAIGLIGFGALVRRGMNEGAAAGPLDRMAVAVADIPATLRHAIYLPVSAAAIGPAPPLPGGLAINGHQPVRDDGYALFVRYSAPARRYVVLLTRLADGAVLRRYAPDLASLGDWRSRLLVAACTVGYALLRYVFLSHAARR